MGLFDIFRSKKEDKALTKIDTFPDTKNKSQDKQGIVPYFDALTSSTNIFELLWFKDGKYKNYEPQKTTFFEDDLFSIEISFGDEPSLLVSDLPINTQSKIDANASIGYFPSYTGMTPDQRWIYLNWLRDVTQPVDIGYVFVFYYGLERHLVYGNFKQAANTAILLRKYHKNSSFQSYSLNALVLSAIAHKDTDTLTKLIESAKGEDVDNALLIAKYVLKMDLSVPELISLSNAAGFKNKRYLKNYPDLFADVVKSQLIESFDQDSFPFYTLDTSYLSEGTIAFANISFSENARYAMIPSIINNHKFKSSVHTILSNGHDIVKKQLKEMRLSGEAPEPKVVSAKNREDDSPVDCPYCDATLEKAPKKKKKCPHCGNYIYVRSSKIIYPSKHLTHEEALATDEFNYLKEYGVTSKKFSDKVEQLNRNSTELSTPLDACIALYDDLILQTTDKFRLHQFYYRKAFVKYQRGIDFISDLQNAAKMELSRYEQEGLTHVTIISADACDECKKLSGKNFTIQKALQERPIPCIKCTHDQNKRGDGWCMCRYAPAYDD